MQVLYIWSRLSYINSIFTLEIRVLDFDYAPFLLICLLSWSEGIIYGEPNSNVLVCINYKWCYDSNAPATSVGGSTWVLFGFRQQSRLVSHAERCRYRHHDGPSDRRRVKTSKAPTSCDLFFLVSPISPPFLFEWLIAFGTGMGVFRTEAADALVPPPHLSSMRRKNRTKNKKCPLYMYTVCIYVF